MRLDNLILGGDIIFSMGIYEVWSNYADVVSLSDLFSQLLGSSNLIDVYMGRINPTWHNRRVGEVMLAQRLDRFFIGDALLERITLFRQWVGMGGI